jgi:hypothetical protein
LIGYEVPLLDQGAVQFMLLVAMMLVVSVVIWFTIAK